MSRSTIENKSKPTTFGRPICLVKSCENDEHAIRFIRFARGIAFQVSCSGARRERNHKSWSPVAISHPYFLEHSKLLLGLICKEGIRTVGIHGARSLTSTIISLVSSKKCRAWANNAAYIRAIDASHALIYCTTIGAKLSELCWSQPLCDCVPSVGLK